MTQLSAETLTASFGDLPIFDYLQGMTPEERLALMDEMDEELAATPDPELKKAKEMEFQVFRSLMRAFI